MRHVDIGHLYVQELVETKQVIAGKVDGKQDLLTCGQNTWLDTGEEVRSGLELLGMVDLTQEGLDRNVGKAHMNKVGSVFEKENNYKRKWQPHKGSRINIRQHHSTVASVKHLRVNTSWLRWFH